MIDFSDFVYQLVKETNLDHHHPHSENHPFTDEETEITSKVIMILIQTILVDKSNTRK